MSLTYANFSVSLHSLQDNGWGQDLEGLRAQLEALVKGHFKNPSYDTDIEVELMESAGIQN